MTTIRVLHVINGLGTGGAERSLQELLPALEERGVRSQIACLHRRTEGVQSSIETRWPVTWLGGGWGTRARQLRGLIGSNRVDIVHSTLFESDQLARIASIRTRAAVVTSLVNTPYLEVRRLDPNIRPWRLAVARGLDGFTSRHLTDHFIALTQAVKDHFVETLRIPEDRITVIPRGRDAGRLAQPSESRVQAVRSELGVGPDQHLIVNIARQEYQKGQADVLHAFQALLQRDPTARLVIAGRAGNATLELTALTTSLGLETSVTWLGHYDNVPELLAAADVFAFPSLYEGLGGSLIEAMAMGVPIVASDIPAIAETAPDSKVGLLVPAHDDCALAEALLRVLSTPGLARRLGDAGRRRYASLYTLDAMADRTTDLYYRLTTVPRR